MELTIHTGFAGDETVVHVDWYDHDNVPLKDTIVIAVRPNDKPRTIDVLVNDVVVATLEGRKANRSFHARAGE